MFDGVQLVSRFLETRYGVNPGQISEAKLTEVLEYFKDNKNVTVLDLYDRITKIYDEDQNFFFKKINQ